MYHLGPNVLLSEGTLGAALAGLQLIFGAKVGNEETKFSGAEYLVDDSNPEYKVIYRVADGHVVWIEDKLSIAQVETLGFYDEPVVGLYNAAQAAFEYLGAPTAGILTAVGATAISTHDAASAAAALGIRQLINSVIGDSEFDSSLATEFKRYVGADGIKAAQNASLPDHLIWDDFAVVLRHEGDFAATSDPEILIGLNEASVDGAAGEDILVGFGDAQMSGGTGNDWLFAKDDASISGGTDGDVLVLLERRS